ncbi:potassium channel family protein [Pseudophaeobacter sp.]|uniref:potassium channel family protein n=1 Tax=Pseudophaeobacter sp. TaxID=1971739 RepID=UPI003297947F
MTRSKTLNLRQARKRKARERLQGRKHRELSKFRAILLNPVVQNSISLLICGYMGWKLFVVQDLWAVGLGSLGPAGATIAAALTSIAYAGMSIFLFFVAKGKTVFLSLATAVLMTLMYAATYEQLGLSGREEFVRWDYIYFSLVTLTTLGYGDIHPTSASQGVAVVNSLFGFFFLAVMIAKLLTLTKIQSVLEGARRS